MRSPFPGMDPYLERYWLSVHNKLITYTSDELNAHLPADLRAEMTERVLVSSPTDDYRRRILPDVYIAKPPGRGGAGPRPVAPVPAATAGGVAVLEEVTVAEGVEVAEPMLVRFPNDRAVEYTLRIVDHDGAALVTAIEFLSGSNKLPGPDRSAYLRKRDEYFDGGVNFVEIDLYRPGDRTLDGVDDVLPADQRSPYLVIAKRGHRPADEWEITPLPLRRRLPAVRLPLRATDRDVWLDLQPLLDRAYANGRYPVDYGRKLDPPLPAADAAWADELLIVAGRR